MSRQSVSASLALSPLTDDPELAGREIRNHLDAAGIRERRCAVCLPLGWLLTLQTKVPDLPEADRAGFLQLEAERGFHSGPEALFIVHSIFQPAAGGAVRNLDGRAAQQSQHAGAGLARRQTQARHLRPGRSARRNPPPATPSA